LASVTASFQRQAALRVMMSFMDPKPNSNKVIDSGKWFRVGCFEALKFLSLRSDRTPRE
jgi:hypothetical protein